MTNSIAAGRRLAVRVVAAQAGATAIIGCLFLFRGLVSAASAWSGGALMVVGTGLLAWRVFAPPLADGRAAMARFAMGWLLKWTVVLAGFYLILARLRLPPLPALSGFGVALLINFLALKFER